MRSRIFAAAALALAAAASAAPWTGHPAADPGGPTVPALCVAPWGVDLCRETGVTVAFAIPGEGDPVVPAGSWWTPFAAWGTNAAGGLPDFPLSYRADYVPAHPDDPMADFVSKLERITFIVDPGSRHERRYVHETPLAIARLLTFGGFWGPAGYAGIPGLNAAPWLEFVPMLRPLSVGPHELQLVFSLSAESCDGIPSLFGEPLTVEGGHCLPAGDLSYFAAPYLITFASR